MRNHRLGRLALLTQGAALVGLGMTQLACGKDATPPVEPLHVNSPPIPQAEVDAAPPAPSAQAAPSAGTPPEAPHTPNAPPPTVSDAGVGSGITRPMMNAPPKKLPPAPTGKP